MGREFPDYRLRQYRGEWCVVWYEREKRRRFSLSLSRVKPKAQAEAALNAWVRKREAARAADTGPLTIAEIFAAYIEDRRKEGKQIKNLGWNWNALKDTFGPLTPADLETANIDVEGEQRTVCHKYAAELFAKGKARDTIWDRLSCLRTAINWAYRRHIVAAKPYVWVPQKGKPRDVVAEEDEVLQILDACVSSHIRLFVLIAIGTGARKSAILQLTWKQVDFDRRIIDFRDRRQKGILDKGGLKGRSVVEFGVVLELALREARELARSDHVIEYAGRPVKDIKQALARAVALAGLKHRNITAHVLRHSVATWLADENVEMRKIQKLLGHQNIKTTDEIYAKYRRGFLTGAAEVIDLKLRRKAAG